MRAVEFPIADLEYVDLDTKRKSTSQAVVLGTIDGFLERQRQYTESHKVRLTVFLGATVVTYEGGKKV